MVSRVSDIQRRAGLVYAQMEEAKRICRAVGEDESFVTADHSMYMNMLERLFSQDFQVARLLDNSDIVVHAEGPAAAAEFPTATVITWLIENVNGNLRRLIQGSIHAPNSAMKNYSLRMNGLAPGSIYAGFSIEDPNQKDSMLDLDGSFMRDAKQALATITSLPQFIEKERLSPDFSDFIIDPVLRDSAIIAAYNLSPTGRNGIHTIELTTPKTFDTPSASTGELSSVSRSVLREAAKRPVLSKKRQGYGSFEGDLRGVDLDKTRVDLRNIDSEHINSLRCFIASFSEDEARNLIGRRVRVFGNYETMEDGKPRLMNVDRIERVEENKQPTFI